MDDVAALAPEAPPRLPLLPLALLALLEGELSFLPGRRDGVRCLLFARRLLAHCVVPVVMKYHLTLVSVFENRDRAAELLCA